jgi:hypothetical protein
MSKSVGRIVVPVAAGLLAPGVGAALSSGLGLGLTAGGIGATALGGAATGALGSALTGGKVLKGALTGAATGALSSGLGQLSDAALGTAGSGGLAGLDSATGITWNAARPGSGLAGALSEMGTAGRALGSGIQQLTTSGTNAGAATTGGGSSMFSGGNLLKALGGARDYMAQSDMEKQLLRANEAAQAQLAPYAQTGTAANKAYQELLGLQGDPEAAMNAITSSPDFRFRFNQGQNALNANLAATGQLDSGAALKAAQEYGQGLASQAYQDRVSNLSGAAGFGANAATGLAGLLSGRGDIQANRIAGQGNVLNQAITGLTGGNVPSIQDILKQMGYA